MRWNCSYKFSGRKDKTLYLAVWMRLVCQDGGTDGGGWVPPGTEPKQPSLAQQAKAATHPMGDAPRGCTDRLRYPHGVQHALPGPGQRAPPTGPWLAPRRSGQWAGGQNGRVPTLYFLFCQQRKPPSLACLWKARLLALTSQVNAEAT